MADNFSQPLIQALLNPACYDHAVDETQLLETHISWVILAGEFAYKLKKTLDLGFADFSTLDKREQYCHEELRLNRRLAPDLYLDVIAITGTPEEPELGGEGEPIEFAVKMRRFPQEALLSHAIEQNTLHAEHIDSLIQEVAEFHGRVEIAPLDSPFGTHACVFEPIAENFRHLLAFLEEETGRGEETNISALKTDVERLQVWSEKEFASHKDLLQERKEKGFIRECHGDMHLNNMLLQDGAVLIFDCIEFNESFRWIDVISEVAFLVMDLEDRGRADYAHRFLNGYLELTGDYAALALLPFYLTYRALVRAKVAGLRLGQEGMNREERTELHKEFHGYLDLAERYTQSTEPMLMITHGYSGSGKTYGTQPVVERFGAIRIRSDVERKRLFGLAPLDESRSDSGVDLYSSEANVKTYHRLYALTEQVVRAGFSVIVDATFLKQKGRTEFRDLAEELGVPFLILDFQASEETLKQRISQRQERHADASEADVDVLLKQLESGEALTADELGCAITIDTEVLEYSSQLVAEIEDRRN